MNAINDKCLLISENKRKANRFLKSIKRSLGGVLFTGIDSK